MNRLARISAAALGALLLRSMPVRAQGQACAGLERLPRAQLGRILRRGSFSGTLDRSASVRFAGCAGEPGAELGVYYYAREWGNRRLTQRLIIVSKAHAYLGMYAVSSPPSKVERTRIVFPYPAGENEIVLRSGRLPGHVHLDGESLTLFK
jgi:hypothetical protein